MTYREKLERVAKRGRYLGRQEANAVLLDAAYNYKGPTAIEIRAFSLRVLESVNALPMDADPDENAATLKSYREMFTGEGAGGESHGVSQPPAPKEKKS